MSLNKKIILLLLSLVILIASCAKVEYTNILDPECPSYVGPDSAADHDGDGIANIYDKDSPLYRVDKDTPTIEILGKNPDTLRFKQSEKAKFDKKIEELRNAFKCYDQSDKSVDNSDVSVTVNVNFIAGDYEIKYTVQDSAGNYRKEIRKVVVIILPEDDKTPPSISNNYYLAPDGVAEIALEQEIDYMEYVFISDNDGSQFVLGENVTIEGSVNTSKPGEYKIKYTAKDKSDNKSSYTITFKVEDKGGIVTDAVIEVYYNNKAMMHNQKIEDTLPDVSFDVDLFTWKAYEFVNNEKVDLSDRVKFDCDYVPDEDGNFTAEFLVKGTNQIEKRVVINIVIYDKGGVDPICDTIIKIELKGASRCTVAVGEKFNDPGFTATRTSPDNADVTNKVSVSPKEVNTSIEATIEVNYSIRTACGTTSKTRTVVVKAMKDETPPVIYLKPSRLNDTVAVGSKYSSLRYKNLNDVIDSIVDNHDGRINITSSRVKIDSSGFKTATAGAPCSLVYTVEDAAKNVGKAVRKFVVIDGATLGLLVKYGVPTSSPLANMENKTFTTITVEGVGGPTSTTNIKELKINFKNDQWGDLWEFAISTKSGSSTHYDLKQKGTFKFKQASPEMKLTSTGLTGFDGEYYVVYADDKFVWVEKTGKFAIVWEE